MQHNLSKIVNLLNDKKYDMSLLDHITHIYLYLLFVKQQYDKLNTFTNIKKTYDELINNFIPFINQKFKYKLNAVDCNKYCECISEMDINEFLNEQHNFNELISESFKKIKELKNKHKEMKNIFTGQNVINYINNIFTEYSENNDLSEKTVLNLFSGSGNLINCIYNNISDTINENNITLCDNNELMNIISYCNINLNLNIELENIIHTNLMHDNILTNNYDIIIADLPDDIRNLIHAECCNKIKQLKIRGTKAEPLIIQLIMNSLNNNGFAVIIVPDGLLFGESNQHIETRKYLLNNFKLDKIVSVGDKKSILIWSNSGHTENVLFTNIDNLYNANISMEQMKEKNYSFYYPNYENIIKQPLDIVNNEIGHVVNISDIVTIYTDIADIAELGQTNPETEYLICQKNNILKICKLNETKAEHVFVSKNITQYNQIYINHYLLDVLGKNLNSLTKGKVKQLNLSAVNNFLINIPPMNVQLDLVAIIEYNVKIININKQQINNYEQLKMDTILNIMSLPCDKLINLAKISHESNKINTIVINRNSTNAGSVSLTTVDKESTTNNYYIEPELGKINNMALFYVLKFYEPKLKEMSKLNNTINLGRTKLENFDIPLQSENLNQVIEKCIKYDEKIDLFNKMNEILLLDLTQIFM